MSPALSFSSSPGRNTVVITTVLGLVSAGLGLLMVYLWRGRIVQEDGKQNTKTKTNCTKTSQDSVYQRNDTSTWCAVDDARVNAHQIKCVEEKTQSASHDDITQCSGGLGSQGNDDVTMFKNSIITGNRENFIISRPIANTPSCIDTHSSVSSAQPNCAPNDSSVNNIGHNGLHTHELARYNCSNSAKDALVIVSDVDSDNGNNVNQADDRSACIQSRNSCLLEELERRVERSNAGDTLAFSDANTNKRLFANTNDVSVFADATADATSDVLKSADTSEVSTKFGDIIEYYGVTTFSTSTQSADGEKTPIRISDCDCAQTLNRNSDHQPDVSISQYERVPNISNDVSHSRTTLANSFDNSPRILPDEFNTRQSKLLADPAISDNLLHSNMKDDCEIRPTDDSKYPEPLTPDTPTGHTGSHSGDESLRLTSFSSEDNQSGLAIWLEDFNQGESTVSSGYDTGMTPTSPVEDHGVTTKIDHDTIKSQDTILATYVSDKAVLPGSADISKVTRKSQSSEDSNAFSTSDETECTSLSLSKPVLELLTPVLDIKSRKPTTTTSQSEFPDTTNSTESATMCDVQSTLLAALPTTTTNSVTLSTTATTTKSLVPPMTTTATLVTPLLTPPAEKRSSRRVRARERFAARTSAAANWTRYDETMGQSPTASNNIRPDVDTSGICDVETVTWRTGLPDDRSDDWTQRSSNCDYWSHDPKTAAETKPEVGNSVAWSTAGNSVTGWTGSIEYSNWMANDDIWSGGLTRKPSDVEHGAGLTNRCDDDLFRRGWNSPATDETSGTDSISNQLQRTENVSFEDDFCVDLTGNFAATTNPPIPDFDDDKNDVPAGQYERTSDGNGKTDQNPINIYVGKTEAKPLPEVVPECVLERKPLIDEDDDDDGDDYPTNYNRGVDKYVSGKSIGGLEHLEHERVYFSEKIRNDDVTNSKHLNHSGSSSHSTVEGRTGVAGVCDATSAATTGCGRLDDVTMSKLKELADSSLAADRRVDYAVLIGVLNRNLDRRDDAITVASLQILQRMSANPDMVPYLLACKAPVCLMELLEPTTAEDILQLWLQFLSDVLWTSKDLGLTYSSLPITEHSVESPSTLYTALYGWSNTGQLKSKAFVLSRHANRQISSLASSVYSCLAN